MSSSWRNRPTGSWWSRLWRPWVSLHPFRGRGLNINEPKTVGIRDLIAPPGNVEVRPARRWFVIGGFFLILFAALVVRLFFLQVVDYKASYHDVTSNSEETITVPATRGEILDREGQALVTNTTTTEIRLSRALATLYPSVKGSLSSLTGISVKQIDADLKNEQYSPYEPAPILANAPPSEVQFVKLHPSEFPGVTVLNVSQRDYPQGGNVAAQVLGYVGPITQQEINADPKAGYQQDSTIGKTGIEAYYEQYLRGKEGTSTLEVSASGSVLSTLKSTPATVGDSVVLNIDSGLQKDLENNLQDEILADRHSIDPVSHKVPEAINGAAVVMNAQNGQVLAMASYPSYDLDSFVKGLTDAEYSTLIKEGAFNNFAIQGLYTPGSTFKLVTATAELQTGILSASTDVDDTGVFKVPDCKSVAGSLCSFHDDDNSAAGEIDLPTALTVSSDYYFYNLGYLFWSQSARYGQTPIQNVATDYGLNSLTNIDLPDEVSSRVDSPQVRQELHDEAPAAFPRETWYAGDNIELAFGQGLTALTPIGLADAYATFANGGTRYAPEVAAAVVNPHGQVVVRYTPRVLGHVNLPASVRDPILQGLEGVVNDPSGTAYPPFHQYANFNLSSYEIAGKTGTASNGLNEEPNSWFVGFGPVGHPQYVVLCVIGEGGYGADASAPVVAKTFNYLVSHTIPAVRLTPELTTPTQHTSATTTTTTPGQTTTTTSATP
ncbi:MAG: penicillin-binding protein 2 [Acidimicrobiales bacterium]